MGEEVMRRQERRSRDLFSGVVPVLFWCIGDFFFVLAFFFFLLVCLVLFSFMVRVGNAAGMRKEYGRPEGERIGLYDVKPPNIQ